MSAVSQNAAFATWAARQLTWTAVHRSTGRTCRVSYLDVIAIRARAGKTYDLRSDAIEETVGDWLLTRDLTVEVAHAA